MPIVVTTISSVAVSASTWNAISTSKLPAGIQVQSAIDAPSSPNGSAWLSAAGTIVMAISHDSDDRGDRDPGRALAQPAPHERREEEACDRQGGDERDQFEHGRVRARLLAHRVVFVDERGPAVPVDRDDDREADGRLCGGDCDHEQRDDRRVGAE